MPINNPHIARLEEDRRHLLRQKANLKRYLERAAFSCSDGVELQRMVRDGNTQLRHLEREYERVCFALGRDPHPPTVRIPPAEVSRAELAAINARRASKVAPVRRDLQAELRARGFGTGYVCKVVR
jgi:hypothetical protein